MKLKVLQENLHQSLNYIQKAIPSKPTLPILSSVLLSAKGNECTIAATDLYFGVRSSVQAEIIDEGEIVIPGKQFREIIASLPPGALDLVYKNGTLTIKSKNSKASLQCLDSNEYPPFPEVQGEQYELSKEYLEKIERYIVFGASTDQARPVLTSVLFSFSEGGLKVVSTDGFRLALMQLSEEPASVEKEMLVPARALSEVFRILSQSDTGQVRFTVSEELKQVFFAVNDAQVFVRLIEGSYPPYEKIVPNSFTTKVTFDTEELANNIKRAIIFSRDASNIVRFHFEGGKAVLKSSSPSLGTFSGDLQQAAVEGEESNIAFNARYLLDFLQAATGQTISFSMSDSLKPATFETEEMQSYQYIIMPFKVNQ